MLCWRGVRITYLDLKLCVVFLRVTWSDIIVLVQSLFLSRELMKKMLPSLVAWLNEIVTTTWSLHGFRTLLFPPSPTCWATLMMQVSMEYVGQKVLHYSRLHEILVSGWIASIQARTRAIHQWLLWSASLHLGPNWPFWSNLGMLKRCSAICFHQRWISPLWIPNVLLQGLWAHSRSASKSRSCSLSWYCCEQVG